MKNPISPKELNQAPGVALACSQPPYDLVLDKGNKTMFNMDASSNNSKSRIMSRRSRRGQNRKEEYLGLLSHSPSATQKMKDKFETNYQIRMNRYNQMSSKVRDKHLAMKLDQLTRDELVLSSIASKHSKRINKHKLKDNKDASNKQMSRHDKKNKAMTMSKFNQTAGVANNIFLAEVDNKLPIDLRNKKLMSQTQSEEHFKNATSNLKNNTVTKSRSKKKVIKIKENPEITPAATNSALSISAQPVTHNLSQIQRTVRRRKRNKNLGTNSRSKSKKSSGRKGVKVRLPELLPCLIDINPPSAKKNIVTPKTTTAKRRVIATQPASVERSDVESRFTNPDPKLANFK